MTEKTQHWTLHWVLTVVGYGLFGGGLLLAVGAGHVALAGLWIGALGLQTLFMIAGIYVLRREYGGTSKALVEDTGR